MPLNEEEKAILRKKYPNKEEFCQSPANQSEEDINSYLEENRH